MTLVYWGLAVASGVIVGLNFIPYPLDIIVLLGLGLGATAIRRRTIGRDSFGTSLLWLLVFAAVRLPLTFIRHAGLFRGG